jgi:hypothetical protein
MMSSGPSEPSTDKSNYSIRRYKVPTSSFRRPGSFIPNGTTNQNNHSSLVGTGHVDKAAIFNSEGNSVWATSPGFSVTPAEMQEVVGAYKDTSEPKKVQSTGLHIAGQKYIVIKADDRSLYGKNVRSCYGFRVSQRNWQRVSVCGGYKTIR